jgi:hypothetical protein
MKLSEMVKFLDPASSFSCSSVILYFKAESALLSNLLLTATGCSPLTKAYLISKGVYLDYAEGSLKNSLARLMLEKSIPSIYCIYSPLWSSDTKPGFKNCSMLDIELF